MNVRNIRMPKHKLCKKATKQVSEYCFSHYLTQVESDTINWANSWTADHIYSSFNMFQSYYTNNLVITIMLGSKADCLLG